MEKEVITAEAVPAKTAADSLMLVANSKPLAENMLALVQNLQIIKKEDQKFLVEHKERWQNVVEKTFIWRTLQQKLSIIHDQYHPTAHAKFQQSILECKVFFEQAVELHAQAEVIKNDLEALVLDKEEVEGFLAKGVWEKEDGQALKFAPGSVNERRLQLKIRELDLKIQQKTYGLQQCQVQMTYRMKEIRDWKDIQDKLMDVMREQGMTEEQMWDKQSGEAESHFFLFLGNYQAVHQSKDTGEIQNLTALARHGIEQAMALGKFEEWSKRCDHNQIKSLIELGYIKINGSKATQLRGPDATTNELYSLETPLPAGVQIEHQKETPQQ